MPSCYNDTMDKAVKDKAGKIVRTVYGYAFLALTLIIVALFIWQIAEVVSNAVKAGLEGGQGAFTREDVGARLRRISPALWLWLASVVIGFILWEIFPTVAKKAPYSDPSYTLARYARKMPKSVSEEKMPCYEAFIKRKKTLAILRYVALGICIAVGIYAIVYFCLPSSFTNAANATEEVLRMVKYLFPAIFAALFSCLAVVIYESVTAKRILPEVKKLTAGEKPKETEESALMQRVHKLTRAKWFLPAVRITVLSAALVMIVVGIFTGNMAGVFRKAVNICTECIGLG